MRESISLLSSLSLSPSSLSLVVHFSFSSLMPFSDHPLLPRTSLLSLVVHFSFSSLMPFPDHPPPSSLSLVVHFSFSSLMPFSDHPPLPPHSPLWSTFPSLLLCTFPTIRQLQSETAATGAEAGASGHGHGTLSLRNMWDLPEQGRVRLRGRRKVRNRLDRLDATVRLCDSRSTRQPQRDPPTCRATSSPAKMSSDEWDPEYEYLLEQKLLEEEGSGATATPPEKKQRTIPPNPMQAMIDGMRSLYKEFIIDEAYVPDIGVYKDPNTGVTFAPVPMSNSTAGKVLAIKWPCARGKSSAFRRYMERGFTANPKRRYLLLSANIAYGRNLTQELRAAFPDRAVGFYKDEFCDLQSYQIVVCSLESNPCGRWQTSALMTSSSTRSARLRGWLEALPSTSKT